MALQRTPRPRFLKAPSGRGDGVPVQAHAGTGRSLRSLGAPLNARSLGGRSSRQQLTFLSVSSRSTVLATPPSSGAECRLMVDRWLRVAASSSRLVPVASVAGSLRST
jgi:hypothetical protein